MLYTSGTVEVLAYQFPRLVGAPDWIVDAIHYDDYFLPRIRTDAGWVILRQHDYIIPSKDRRIFLCSAENFDKYFTATSIVEMHTKKKEV